MKSKPQFTPPDLFIHERAARRHAPALIIAGIDEAGRGPLAGPVVAAAVILPIEGFSLPVADSKSLSESSREQLAESLSAHTGVYLAVASCDADRIDQINILRATHEAMAAAAASLSVTADLFLLDGRPVRGFPYACQAIIRGDAVSASIAAASIIAKTRRDQLMREYDQLYPGYGFAQNKGYGTAQHLEALRQLGPCPVHRQSFAPVKEIIQPDQSKQLWLDFTSQP